MFRDKVIQTTSGRIFEAVLQSYVNSIKKTDKQTSMSLCG